MRKAFLMAAIMAATIGAGAVARAKGAPELSDQPEPAPLPHDAYPDELSLSIWNPA